MKKKRKQEKEEERKRREEERKRLELEKEQAKEEKVCIKDNTRIPKAHKNLVHVATSKDTTDRALAKVAQTSSER